jgi:hypothetical protein
MSSYGYSNNTLYQYLNSQKFYSLKNKQSYSDAALLYFKCRKQGVTIRSTIDLLIAQTAIENDLFLLHFDNDFINMSKVITSLKLF